MENALAAALVYATSLGVSRREARQLAGLPVRPRLLERWSLARWLAALAFAAACAACAVLVWFVVLPRLDRGAIPPPQPGPLVPAAEPVQPAAAALPQPWEIEIDVYNGSGRARAATAMTNTIAGLAYRVGSVGIADRRDYPRTLVYYPPGAQAIAERLAAELGVGTAALPGGDDPLRLVVIVGADGPL